MSVKIERMFEPVTVEDILDKLDDILDSAEHAASAELLTNVNSAVVFVRERVIDLQQHLLAVQFENNVLKSKLMASRS